MLDIGVVAFLGLLFGLIPLAIVGALSGFRAQESTALERAFTMAWLVFGIVCGFMVGEQNEVVIRLAPHVGFEREMLGSPRRLVQAGTKFARETLDFVLEELDGLPRFPRLAVLIFSPFLIPIIPIILLLPSPIYFYFQIQFYGLASAIGGMVVTGKMPGEYGICTIVP